jgi:DNA invertase Pin-like site-specific DNA recombinase
MNSTICTKDHRHEASCKLRFIIGYARVSTSNQNTDNQVQLLKESGCTEVFIDEAISGSNNHHSDVYRSLMARVKELRDQGHIVTVRVTKLDRWSRSTQHMLEGVEELGEMGASFEALNGGFAFDANSPTSTLILTVMAAVAEFERELIRSRMAEGREAKKVKGLLFGPKPKLTQAAVNAITATYKTGTTTDRKLAGEWGVSRSTIARVLGLYGHTAPYVSLDQWEAAKKKANQN